MSSVGAPSMPGCIGCHAGLRDRQRARLLSVDGAVSAATASASLHIPGNKGGHPGLQNREHTHLLSADGEVSAAMASAATSSRGMRREVPSFSAFLSSSSSTPSTSSRSPP